MEMNLTKKSVFLWASKILICTISIFLLGLGCALNIATSLGADPISVFYDGSAKLFPYIGIGWIVNIINFTLAAIVFFIDRKYINIGTVIHVFGLGHFIKLGLIMYSAMNVPDNFWVRLIISLIGCFICYIGLGGYISIDIGIDPWTAITIILSKKLEKFFKKLKKPFSITKIIADIITLAIGFFAGGTVGIITLFTAIVGGPMIQKFKDILDKLFAKMLKFKGEDY